MSLSRFSCIGTERELMRQYVSFILDEVPLNMYSPVYAYVSG